MVARPIEIIVPNRLGRRFRWLLSAAVVNNIGDGIVLAAGPLLVASQTSDPFLVSMAVLSEYLPTLLFGVLGGAAADRFDRRRMVIVVDLVRAAALVVLAATILTGVVSIAVVLITLFVLGTAETLADSASSAFLPSLVARDDLGLANARMQGAFLLANQLVAPPIGAFLFATGMAIPFVANAVCFLLGAVLVSRIVGSARIEVPERASLRAEMAEGIRWLLGHPPMRTLALTIFTFNVTFGAAWSVLVLYAGERLGMGAVGFGLLTTAVAVGGIAGTLSYGRLERRFSLGDIMRTGLLIETGTHLSLAVTTSSRRRTGNAGGVRRPCVRVGDDRGSRPTAGGPGRVAGPGDGRLPRRDHRRTGHRDADRRPPGEVLRDHRPVLVRVHRLGPAGRGPVATLRQHRPRRRSARRRSPVRLYESGR